METKKSNLLILTGVFAAIGASFCCVGPLIAILAGTGGTVASFSVLEAYRPVLIASTIIVLSIAWFIKLKSAKSDTCSCNCAVPEKSSFLKKKSFLLTVTLFSVLMLAFPYYSGSFYPEQSQQAVGIGQNSLKTAQMSIRGMTCDACAKHIESQVGKQTGVKSICVSFDKATAFVKYDPRFINLNQIRNTINSIGYKVVEKDPGK